MSAPVRLGLVGAGRIGRIHAGSVTQIPDAELVAVADSDEAAAASVAGESGARAVSVDELLADPAVQGVLIATPTEFHAAQIGQAANAGKVIFCEKPIALDMQVARRCVFEAARSEVPLMIGFNRRFDPSFRRLREAIDGGRIGDVELVQITSRDPAPPPLSYIERSGGLFRDMAIHDFDMLRFLIGEEIVEVAAMGTAAIDPAIGNAGDVDTATVMLRSSGGRLALVSNSRRACYGYDQRIEVHGSGGMVSAGNPVATTVELAGREGFMTDPLGHFFMERYADAYRQEIETFCAVVRGEEVDYPDGWDGLAALAVADAATESLATGRMVAVSDVSGPS